MRDCISWVLFVVFLLGVKGLVNENLNKKDVSVIDATRKSSPISYDMDKLQLEDAQVSLTYQYNITVQVKNGPFVSFEVMDEPVWQPILLPTHDRRSAFADDPNQSDTAITNTESTALDLFGRSALDAQSSTNIIGSLRIPSIPIKGPAEITLQNPARDIHFTLPHAVDAGVEPVQRIVIEDGVTAYFSGCQMIALEDALHLENFLLPADHGVARQVDLGSVLRLVVDSVSEIHTQTRSKLHRVEYHRKPTSVVVIRGTATKSDSKQITTGGVIQKSSHKIELDSSKLLVLEKIIRSQLPRLPETFAVSRVLRAEIKMTRITRIPAKQNALFNLEDQVFVREILVSESANKRLDIIPITDTLSPYEETVTSRPVIQVGNRNVSMFIDDAGWYPHKSPVAGFPL